MNFENDSKWSQMTSIDLSGTEIVISGHSNYWKFWRNKIKIATLIETSFFLRVSLKISKHIVPATTGPNLKLFYMKNFEMLIIFKTFYEKFSTTLKKSVKKLNQGGGHTQHDK